MSTHTIDAMHLRCPQPMLSLITHMPKTRPGDIVEITANCESFEDDVRRWTYRMGKTMLAVTRSGDAVTAQIQV